MMDPGEMVINFTSNRPFSGGKARLREERKKFKSLSEAEREAAIAELFEKDPQRYLELMDDSYQRDTFAVSGFNYSKP